MTNNYPQKPIDYDIKILNNLREIEEIRPIWEKIQSHPNADIDHYLTVINSSNNILSPYVILLSKNSVPIALMVGRIELVNMECRFGYKVIYSPKVRSLTFIYGGFMGETSYDNVHNIVKEIMNFRAKKEVDVIFFSPIQMDSSVFEITKNIPSFFFRDHITSSIIHRKMLLPETFEKFYCERTKKVKSKIRMCRNRINKKFGENLSIKCYKKIEELDKFLAKIERIASKTYQRGLNVGFKLDSETHNRLEFAMRQNYFRGYVLYFNNNPSAFWIGIIYRGIFYPWTTGYDPDYYYYSPGSFLFLHVVDELCKLGGIKAIDFGFGDADYKRNYCNQNWQEASVYIYSPTLIGIKLNLLRSMIILIDSFAKNCAERFNILRKTKRLWRNYRTKFK